MLQSDKPSIEQAMDMKKCLFCAELIQDEAIKCRYCGEFLDGRPHSQPTAPRVKWYRTNAGVIIALLCAGPLALPLVWFNPRYKATTKAIVTGIVVIATVLAYYFMNLALKNFMNQVHALGM